jgi:ankyrin repeat protein
LPGRLDDDAVEIVILAALSGPTDAIVDLVGADFHGRVHGSPDGTLLHHAAWVGSPAVVGRLLDRGADPDARSGAGLDTPLAWAAHGSGAHELPGRDYVAVAERLVGAGAKVDERFAEVAEGPLSDWLGRRASNPP